MSTVRYRFEAHDGEIFEATITSEQDVREFVEKIWDEKVREIPYQLADADLVLRFARSLPGWILEELPQDAVAWAVLARHEKERWVILWVMPILIGDQFGPRYIYGEELHLQPCDMRMIV